MATLLFTYADANPSCQVPKRKPQLARGRRKPPAQDVKPPTQPKKFMAFSASDSRSIETEYQSLLEQVEDDRAAKRYSRPASSGARSRSVSAAESLSSTSPGLAPADGAQKTGVRVPVNEDFLFDVDIESRELCPVYWQGPVYEVRRGTWFYQEGSTLRPCEENLAAQLEEGYLKTKPWLNLETRPRADSNTKDKHTTAKPSSENVETPAAAQEPTPEAAGKQARAGPQPQPYRLFGVHMNDVATYQDANTAWLTTEGMLSWVTSTMYERFAGGGFMGGIKLVRGYTDLTKSKALEEKRPATPTDTPGSLTVDEKQQRLLKRRSAPPSTRPSRADDQKGAERRQDEPEPTHARLERQISSLMEPESRDPQKREEEIRKREEEEIEGDYNAQDGETQGRDIEHLVLVTHGIGQLLGLRYAVVYRNPRWLVADYIVSSLESVNFVHDVNVMRKTLKAVYSQSADLRALNSELGAGPGNCRIQGERVSVLPRRTE